MNKPDDFYSSKTPAEIRKETLMGNRKTSVGGNRTVNMILVILLLVFIVYTLFTQNSNKVENVRVKLEGTASPQELVIDEDNWADTTEYTEAGMLAFYEDTGVQPFLYLISSSKENTEEDLKEFADEYYKNHITDESHFLVVFDHNTGKYSFLIGNQAKQIMDEEALGIFDEYIQSYYRNLKIDRSQVFANVYRLTGQKIMGKNQSPVMMVIMWVLVAVIAAALIYRFKKSGSFGEFKEK